MKGFPWDQAMAFGLGVLKLSPKQFWAMTPRELQAAFSVQAKTGGGDEAINRPELERLMQNFPDKDTTT